MGSLEWAIVARPKRCSPSASNRAAELEIGHRRFRVVGESGTGLLRGEVQGYDVDRMIVQFTMINDGRVIPCAISSAAMDAIEGGGDIKSDQRVDQFLRLRDVIEKRATCRFLEGPPQPNRPLVLRSNDF
jgi:hypothetical protein